MSETEEKKPNKRKFRQTRQLVRMALNDGWTQKEIEKKCRISQSIVSGWKSGSTLATEEQIKPLLEIYGNKLRRKSFQVYQCYDPDSKKRSYVKVEGRILFSHTVSKSETTGKMQKRISVFRYVVHDQGNGDFMLIKQDHPLHNDGKALECSQEQGVWHSSVHDQMDVEGVIREIELLAAEIYSDFKDDGYTMPFLIRKAFVENGYPVRGIVDYPATW
jgi:transcriptional regulator with XRE-family HTH domain